MEDSIKSPLAMQPVIKLPLDTSTINYESQDEKDDSERQLLWHRIMHEGGHKSSTIYTKVEVLMLGWWQSSDKFKEEMDRLRFTFERRFKYHTEVRYLDTTVEKRLQRRINSIVTGFVDRHDGPNTLLIVYYAGHARPVETYGDLQLFGKNLTEGQHKRQDVGVWNQIEKFLLPAESDVLQIFDCCYAGNLSLVRSTGSTIGLRSFENLAATTETGVTPIPGQDSFTSALIYALEALVEEKEGGLFTTVELLSKITRDAPYFSKDQRPVLSNPLSESECLGNLGIMLHPLQKEGPQIGQPQIKASSLDHERNRHLTVPSTTGAAILDQFKRSILTLHFDFREKPSVATVEKLAREMNGMFNGPFEGLHRVRWGGIRQSMTARAVKAFQAELHRNRRSRRPFAGSNFTGTQLMSILDKSEDDDNMSDISSASTMSERSPDRAATNFSWRADMDSESWHNSYRDRSTQTYPSGDQPSSMSQRKIDRKNASRALNVYIHRLYVWLYTSTVSSRIFDTWIGNQEPPLDEGKVRVRWICQCGKRLWDDFVELRTGAAEDLRKNLECFENNVLRRPQGSASSAEGTSVIQEPLAAHLPASSTSSAVSSGVSTSLGSSEISPSAVIAARGTSPCVTTSRSLQNPDDKFLLLCLSKTNDTLRVSQIPVQHITNDFQLFCMLRDVYATYRGTFARLFSPRKIVSLNFRKFERHPCDRAVILPSPDIVPQRTNPDACHKDHSRCDTDYDIHPSPPDLDPYIGRNGLAHLLHCPHEAEEHGNNLPLQNVWLNRFPKKEKTKLTVCPPHQFGLGWGIEMEEGWHVSWLMKVIVATFLLAAIVFLICWWRFRGDVQGATNMAALLVSYGLFVITLFSAIAML